MNIWPFNIPSKRRHERNKVAAAKSVQALIEQAERDVAFANLASASQELMTKYIQWHSDKQHKKAQEESAKAYADYLLTRIDQQCKFDYENLRFQERMKGKL